MDKIVVTVTGLTGSGKSIILALIESALKSFGIRMVLSPDLEAERRLNNPDKPPEHELRSLLSKSYIYLEEINIPRDTK